MKPMFKEQTHIVLKIADCMEYLSKEQQAALVDISKTVVRGRDAAGKNPIANYLVVNTDEAYAADVQAIILKNTEETTNGIGNE